MDFVNASSACFKSHCYGLLTFLSETMRKIFGSVSDMTICLRGMLRLRQIAIVLFSFYLDKAYLFTTHQLSGQRVTKYAAILIRCQKSRDCLCGYFPHIVIN